MTELQRELLSTITAWLNGEEIRPSENQKELCLLAKAHGVLNPLYLAVKNVGWEQEVFIVLKRWYQANLHQQISQDFVAESIFEKFREKKIRYMPLKGYVLKNYYPETAARISCDVDIFYDKTRKSEVDEIMTELGLERGKTSENDEGWEQDTVTIEMHHSLVSHYYLYQKYYENVWERLLTDDGIAYRFSKEDFFIYFIVHAAKHFYHGGLGVRFILDLYMLRKNMEGVDEEYLSRELEKLELKMFTEKLEKLSRVWFGGEEETSETQAIGDFIFNCGLYGNAANLASSQAESESNAVGEGAVKRHLIKNRLFPSAKAISDRYTILKKYPFLLPFVWVWRWFDVLLFRRKSIKNTIQVYRALDDENIKKRSDVMNLVGLKNDLAE